jgi:hypothetical protein
MIKLPLITDVSRYECAVIHQLEHLFETWEVQIEALVRQDP